LKNCKAVAAAAVVGDMVELMMVDAAVENYSNM